MSNSRAAALAGLLMVAIVASAQQPDGSSGRRNVAPTLQDPRVGADVGTGWNILPIPAAEFVARESGIGYRYEGDGYMYWSSGALLGVNDQQFWAPVQLPSGAGIGYLNLYSYDTAAAANITAVLWRYDGWGVQTPCPFVCQINQPDSNSLITVASSGSGGYQYNVSALENPLHTVNNRVTAGGAQYAVTMEAGVVGDTLRFKGVDLWWKRQIAPAPGAASFTDVPPGAQFFAEIEAMKESGITAGCTPTEFCPETTVTRRQMAAFFARALGLYFQY